MRGEMDMMRQEWHLDRKVTLGLIAAIVFQGMTFVWWASKIDTKVSQHDQKFVMMDASIIQLSAGQNHTNVILAKIQKDQEFQSELLKEVRDEVKKK